MSGHGSTATAPAGPGALAPLSRVSDLRLLLIEDSSSDSELVRALLEHEFPNADIDAVPSLDLALDRLAVTAYDLVLADLTLPDADGATVVRAVRSAQPETALMVLTGRTDGALALWTLAEGAQDYLVKGQHDGPRLATALLHALQRQRAEIEAHARLSAALLTESMAVEHLREVSDAKSEFVATISHELRTPLTSIAGYVELLEDEGEHELSPTQTRFVRAIARNTDRLSSLADDLLHLAGFNARPIATASPVVDLRDVVGHAREVLATIRPPHPLSVSFELPELPVLVRGDSEQLERVVLNLMSNAYKFSDAGGSVVCRVEDDAESAALRVTNTGVLIPEAERAELFTRFFRGSSARDRAIQGTGLGLAIVASVVATHHGAVSVESDGVSGTSFLVRLPRADADPE